MSHLTEKSKISFAVLSFILSCVVGSVWAVASMNTKVLTHEEELSAINGSN